MQHPKANTTVEKNNQPALKRSKYGRYCSCIINISWLSADLTVMNFYMLRDFVLNIDHRHNFKEILYVESGSGSIIIEGSRRFNLKKGALFYMDAGVTHRLIPEFGKPMRICVTSFTMSPGLTSDKIPRELIDDERRMVGLIEDSKHLIGTDTHGCGRILRSILDAMDTSRPGEFVKIKNSISSYILGAFQSLVPPPGRDNFGELLESVPVFNIMKIMRYMRKHYAEGISLPSVAEALHYSPRQCQRIIYERMGMSFSELLLDFQLTHAKKLLESTNETLEEIAEHSGFRSGKSFSRQFKGHMGITPYRYRKQILE